ncbi:MAG: TerB family tellurite resistance protein [Phycisphaerales bacterium]
MTTMEREAIAAVCLFAAWADGTQTDVEREAIRRALEEMGPISDAVFQRVAMKRTTIEEEASRILEPANRDAAFEMAVGVCSSDGSTTSAEKTFLQRLAIILQINEDKAREMIAKADEMVDLAQPGPAAATTPPPIPSAAPVVDSVVTKQVDDAIMTYSAINAGLELLPQSLATFGIVPLQARMVYKVGSLYGYKLDSGHIKEFIATVGLGMGGQFVESYARKALGGLVGKFLGKTAGKIVSKTTGPVITFATTYALGQVAKSYYSSGRKLSMSALQQQFSKTFEDAKTLYAQKEPEIRAQASKMEPSKLLNLVRGV